MTAAYLEFYIAYNPWCHTISITCMKKKTTKTHLINPKMYSVSLCRYGICAFWNMLMCLTVLCQDCSMAAERLTQNQNIITLSWPARSPALLQIEHVKDILVRNIR